DLAGHRLDDRQHQVAPVAGGRDVQKGQLVGALLVVARGDLDRVAGVAQFDEIDALDHAPAGHVQAGNDALREHALSESVGQRLGAGEVQFAAVDGASADDAFDALVFNFAELLDVGDAGQAARGDHRHRQGLRKLHGGVDIDAGEHAVAADIGVDEGFDAVVLELARQVHDLVPSQFAPAVGGNLAVFRVQSDDDVAAERGAGVLQEAGVLDRGRADDDVAQAGIQVALDRVEVANPAAELHIDLAADLTQDLADGQLVFRFSRKRTVQIDQVQAPRALVNPTAGHLGR